MPAIAIGALDDCRTRDGSHRSRRKRRSCYPKSSIIEKLAAITCLSQVVFGAMLTTLGLAGMPADMEVAGKILSVGLVQALIGTPGVVGWKLGNDRLWLLYGTIQLVIGVSEICWMAEAILLKTTISAVVLALLAVFQIWSTVITILHLRIDGCSHLSQVARGENHKSSDSKSYAMPVSRLSPSISPGLKSPNRKSASKSHSRRDSSKASSMASGSAKHSMQSSASHGKDGRRHEQITLKRYQRASARLNKLVNKQDSTNQSSLRDSEASIAARMKCVPEAKTPPISISEHDSSIKVRKSPNYKKPRRFYFSEYDDVNSLSESDPENSTKQMSSSKQQLGSRHCIYVPRSRGVIALEVHTPPSSECSVIPAPCRPSPIAVTPPLAIQAEPVVPVAPNTQPQPKVEKKVPSSKSNSNAAGSSVVSTPPHEAPSSSPKKPTP
uniref:MgtE domain-containing protein n=1 Tax=Panagrellus redivivus TaxID=6233 RepID=A0A7E4UTL2_PANRE